MRRLLAPHKYNEITGDWRAERYILILTTLFIGVNFVALGIVRPDSIPSNILSFVTWLICAVVGHGVLNRFLPKRDKLLFPIVMMLSGWGLVTIDRLAPRFADRQTAWLAVGVVAMLLVVRMPDLLRWLRQYRYLWLMAGLGLLLSTMLLGSNPSGMSGAPQLWLGFWGVFFQPSEALKVILVAFLASYLAEQYPSMRSSEVAQEWMTKRSRLSALSPRVVGPVLLMWGLSVLILVWQRDLGTAVLFFAVFVVLLYTASGYSGVLVGGGLLIMMAGYVGYHLFAVVRLRFDIWLNPWADADGRAYQIVQSLQAMASGSVFGQGVGQGFPVYIPVVHSDFVYMAVAEEWGLLGAIVVIALFAVLVARGLQIALLNLNKPFEVFLAVGLTMMIGLQSILIMGGVTRLLPLTGVTLPFISYGGSSMLMSFIMIGVLLRLSAVDRDEMG